MVPSKAHRLALGEEWNKWVTLSVSDRVVMSDRASLKHLRYEALR